MTTSDSRPLLPPQVSKVLGRVLIFLLLVAGVFTFPSPPDTGLDPSWRMALGYFFENGMQFGRDVVFTYGPLGFVMAKTFSGLQFWTLIAGQLVLAVVAATALIRQGYRLAGHARLVFFLFILLFAVLYEDAIHMIVLAILGFELLTLLDRGRGWGMIPIVVVLAGFAQIKFTGCLFAGFIMLVMAGYGLWRRRIREVVAATAVFLVVYLGIWVACGQQLANLPAYFRGSWAISQGYQWAMGFPAPAAALWKALVILGVLAVYAILPLFLGADKPRAWANSLLLGAYVYLNWKHGFVRADGHMLGFFFCAMLPLICYPGLLNDPPIFRFAHRWVFALALLLSVWALEAAYPGTVRMSVNWAQDRIWRNVGDVADWKGMRQRYRDQIAVARTGSDLVQMRKIVGDATIDVLGSEQSIAIFNRFNYRPRPVIQSYSTFTPELARLNRDFIVSDRAPEFFLVRIETIDERLLTLDDAQVLQLLPYRYEYVLTERNYQLWRRLPGPFDAAAHTPKPIRTETAKVNQPLALGDLETKPLWASIDLRTSLLGKLRAFLYKPPQVMLNIADTGGSNRDYLMPLPQGRNGFILAPLVNDTVDYMRYASGKPLRWVRSITVKIAPSDVKYFAGTARVEFSALPPLPTTGEGFFPKDIDTMFTMFRTRPIAYESHTPFSVAQIDGKNVAIMHAPSLMTFNLPPGAKYISGLFGYMPQTYTGDGKTNGGVFTVYWSNGLARKDLFRRYLNPLTIIADRGLQPFKVDLSGIGGGSIYLQVEPGPYNDLGWDWTGWTDIYIAP